MERMLDKRKARDKETDDDLTDNSLNKNPTKRARVDYSSSSPKEKSPSPASAQKSPLVDQSVDSIAAATPAPSMGRGSANNNGDDAMALTGNPGTVPKFDLPSPFTTQEMEQLGEENADSDNDSSKFLSDIIKSEQIKKEGKLSNNGKEGESNGTPSPRRSGSSEKGVTNNLKFNSKSSQRPLMTSSPNSELVLNVTSNMDVEVTIKVVTPGNHQIILEETTFKSDLQKVDSFLKQSNVKLPMMSSQTQSSSGYLGDISSSENSAGLLQGSSKSSRWTMSSLGSTIPRQSIVSIATDTSEGSEELMKRPGRPPLVSKSRKRSDGPIATSTKIEDDSTRSTDASLLDRMNVSSGNQLSNGDDYSASSSSGQSSGRSQKSRNPNSAFKNSKSSPGKVDRDEGIGTTGTPSQSSTPGSSKKRDTPKSSAAKSTPSSGTDKSSSKKPSVRRRRGGSANNFPITGAQPPVALSEVLNTPPPVRSVAKIEGTSAKPLTRFELEMNNEPVIEKELEKGATLWSTIVVGELVFARWRDKNYYSGMVKSKGHNDTWIIDFDDGMEDVASESHIVPIRILGVGLKGIYSPDTGYEPHNAEVIGQKFGLDPDTRRNIVKYAIKCHERPTPIFCSRRQLSIEEADAKKLRLEYQPPVLAKAGDVSLDNIVDGPRRRTRGGAESNDSSGLIAGGFDASISEGNPSATTTPKPRGRKPASKTPASDAKKKRPSTSTLQVKETHTSPAKDSGKESPTRNPKSNELVKKKPKKTLFQGMQFFLTASGGGDPGISGNPAVTPNPYDKDEYRELIENCGGITLDTVGGEGRDDIFLISDSYARTVKYIYCLAAGIPCVSHTWIKTCLDKNEIVDWNIFHLPAGWSLENQDLIPHHTKKPFKGCKIFVTSESDQLYNYWKPVLTAADAVLLKPSRKKGTIIPQGTEVVVTDNNSDSTKDILAEAKELNIHVVKPEWLVQTIITGEKAHMYGHDKYKVTVNESEETEGDTTEDRTADFKEPLSNMQDPD